MSLSKSQKFAWPSFLRWPAFLLANVVLCLLIGVSTLRETYRGWTVDREIRALEAQAKTLEGRKLTLAEFADSLASPDRVEQDARRRLGWKQPGERVVVLSGYEATGTWNGDGPIVVPLPTSEPLTNPQRWWKYFFHSSYSSIL